jgi:hypothetical protein
MQLVINTQNENLFEKIVKFLDIFKSDGLEVEILDAKDKEELSDEYIEEHWKELLMGIKSDPDYYKSEQYKLDRGEYLMEKYR